MGKLGACELNFSSDIDLIFAFAENGTTRGGKRQVTNAEYFTALCRDIVRLIGAQGPEGVVFRVDLGLRPYGDSGPVAMSFDAMELYYQEQGREWERYAMIKARACAGDRAAGKRLLERLKPFVYRRYLDYGTYDSLRDMKKKISVEVARKGIRDNIKLGIGGIREIEFFGQVFQLIRGGVEPSLQERSILKVLAVLAAEGYIPQAAQDELTRAYHFLRNTEHRLQEYEDRQTHDLPQGDLQRRRLALSMGFADWPAFASELARVTAVVHDHFNHLLEQETVEESQQATTGNREDLQHLWEGNGSEEEALALLKTMGYDNPEAALKHLQTLRQEPSTGRLSAGGRRKLDLLIPAVIAAAGRSEEAPDVTLGRIVTLLTTIQQRTCYLSLLLENKNALHHLVRLTGASPFIASFLSRHPVLLDELLDPRTLYAPPEKADLEAAVRRRLARMATDDLEYQMEELCIFKQVNLLRVVSADVTGILPLMKVSDRLSYIAETVVDQVIDLSWSHLTGIHGTPACHLQNGDCGRGFAVIAYGKLGGLELGYGSDLDLVFLHAGTNGETTGGRVPIDSPQFFARLGQRMIHIMTTHTAAGRLYEIDMRLRPSGAAGMLVSHVEAFATYQLEAAWTWEHQALVRARFISGNAAIGERFDAIRKEVIARPRDCSQLRSEVQDMRQRLRHEQEKRVGGKFDIKQGAGGIVDIEFLVQYLILANAHANEALVEWTDNVRMLETLARNDIMDQRTAMELTECYLAYRHEAHRMSLNERPALVSDSEHTTSRQRVAEAWQRYLGSSPQAVP
jgi:glutamate-ammonia-ligase adenylyltransferase